MGGNKGITIENATAEAASEVLGVQKKITRIRDATLSFKEISADEYVRGKLHYNPSSALLVDCRSPDHFRHRKIKNFINAPFVELPNPTNTHVKNSSRSEAVRILLKVCPKLLLHLYHPGCFTDIVVIENHCRIDNIPIYILDLMRALSMWTGADNAKTNIWFLREGFYMFASKYPRWICSNTEMSERPIPWTTPGDITKLVEYESVPTPTDNDSNEGDQLRDSLYAHLDSLSSAIQATAAVRDSRLKKCSLEAIEEIIIEEEREDIKVKVDGVVPADVKCLVCYQVFPGKIYQCTNGHCICSTCCENLRSCPECRVSYDCDCNGRDSRKIRVKTLELLLETTSVKVDCANGCGEKLFYSQVEDHLQICVKGNYADVKKRIRKRIELERAEIESLNELLKTLNNEVLKHELRWNYASPNLVAGVSQELMEEMFTNKIKLANAQMALALEVLMKTPSHTDTTQNERRMKPMFQNFTL